MENEYKQLYDRIRSMPNYIDGSGVSYIKNSKDIMALLIKYIDELEATIATLEERVSTIERSLP